MSQYLRCLWCLAAIIYLGNASAEENQACSCLPRTACSQAVGGESPCPEPDHVYCCLAPAIHVDNQELHREILSIHEQEQADHGVLEGNHERQEKSIGNSKKNGLISDNKKKNDKKPDKIFIVYAESNTRMDEVRDKANHVQIVLPLREEIDDLSKDDKDNGETTTQAYKIEQSVKKSTEKLPPTIHVHKSLGSSKLHKLFPKRRFSPSVAKAPESAQNNEKDDEDLEPSASEVDEISMTVSGQPSEQTAKPFRAPPRHLARQPVRNESSRQRNKGVHDLFRGRSKNATAIPETQPNTQDLTNKEKHATSVDIPKDEVAENINLKVINDIIKTNYTGRFTSGTLGSSITHINNMKPSTNTPVTENQEQTTPLTEARNDIVRKRLHNRRPLSLRSRQQSVSTATISEPQTTPGTTGLKPSFRDSLRRPLSSRTSAVTPQAQEIQVTTEFTAQGSGNTPSGKTTVREQLKTKIGENSPVFGARTSRFRQRPTLSRGAATATARNDFEKEGQVQVLPSVAAPESKTPENHSYEASLTPSQTEAGETGRALDMTPDLAISASNILQSSVPPPGKFQPPLEMEVGFEPINIRDLKTVGPLPGGFLQQARSFNEDPNGFGLSLPGGASAPSSTIDPLEDFDYNSMLLPPVFLPPGRVVTTLAPVLDGGIDPADLLPPVQLPMPLMWEMSRESDALKKIQQEFDVLKGQYDLLLSRYADTLRQYNDEYEKIIESSKTSTDSVNEQA